MLSFDTIVSWAYFVVPTFAVVWYILSGLHVVDQWERCPVKRFGKYTQTLGPGITWLEPFSNRIIDTVYVQDQVVDVLSKLGYKSCPTLQTHDNVPVSFNTVLTWKVMDAAKFKLEVDEAVVALYRRTMTAISENVSKTQLDEILHDRTVMYNAIRGALQIAVMPWGVEIIAIEIKDVTITDTGIQEAIAMKARAQKEGEAELIRATMQKAIAEQLKEAAEVYDEDSWHLKGFETMLEMCRSAQNNTIVIPTNLLAGLARISAKF